MSRYFGDLSPKYSVSKGFDMIFHGEISVRRYFGIYREKSPISRDISCGQRGSTKVRPATVMLAVAATVPHLYLLLRGFEPQTKRLGVQPAYHLG